MMGDDNFSRWPKWAQTHLVAFAPDPADEADESEAEYFAELPPEQPATRSPRPRRSRRAVMLAAGAAVVVAALAVTFVVRLAMSVGGDDPSLAAVAAMPTTAAPQTSNAPAAAASGFCPATDTPQLWVGNGAGATDSAQAAIAGFEHAYYTDRSGHKAHTFTTPDAAVPPADEMQRGIDATVTEQTDYCLRIRPGEKPDTHNVSLTVRDETGEGSFDQIITTARAGDRVLITAITAAE